MGIEAAIIHGREDRLSLPVRFADVAYANYKTNPLDTYLDIESVIHAAKEMGCDAVHPGYGFLAENATFVRRLQEEGITFIGPSADVITLLGDKIEARAAMEAAGLPTAKGSSEPISDAASLRHLLKKSATQSSSKPQQVVAALVCKSSSKPLNLKALSNLCQSRAKSALVTNGCSLKNTFKALSTLNSRFLVMAKKAIHFGERFCSIQRRHQKLVEEGPLAG